MAAERPPHGESEPATITPYRNGPYLLRGNFTILDQDGDGWPELRLRLGTAYTDGAEEADPCDAHASEWWVIDVATALVQGHFVVEQGYAEAYYEALLHGRASWNDVDGDGHRDVTLHLVREEGNPSDDDPESGPVERTASVETYRYEPSTDTYVTYVPPAEPATAPAPATP